jgi:hypothetical protein
MMDRKMDAREDESRKPDLLSHSSISPIFLSLIFLSAFSLLPSSSRAALVVTVGDLQLLPGGSGSVDVIVSGDYDPVRIAGYEFRIRTTGQTRLGFLDPQPTDWLADPDYLFQGDSYDAAMSAPIVGHVSQMALPGDTFTGSDMTASAGNVLVMGSWPGSM